MNDADLRLAVARFRKKYGTTLTFIAINCGISREHLSRWLNNDSYVLSDSMKTKIKVLIKEK